MGCGTRRSTVGRRLGLGRRQVAAGVSAGELGAETWSRHTRCRTRSADSATPQFSVFCECRCTRSVNQEIRRLQPVAETANQQEKSLPGHGILLDVRRPQTNNHHGLSCLLERGPREPMWGASRAARAETRGNRSGAVRSACCATPRCAPPSRRPQGAMMLRRKGHLMGKKSTGDFPYAYEEGNKTPFSALPENIKQLEDYLQWEEISKYLLRLLEGNENKSAHFLKGGLPWSTRNTWETDDNSSWKDMMDYLLQVVNMKESTPS
ncbi:PREDICTED: gastrin-releasing peptide [Charadrius vociferus]|uniref:gastrin-releasing peptide n=1 Tax=Charadrius vociferus TaxID=50402 RepID=UPI000521AA24|nr:PREDICTED: gastrin-releasing peptide [Charadrius vociferus]